MSRRLYRRRADMIVFTTIGVVLIGVVAVYFELQEETQRGVEGAEVREVEEQRLLILATEGPADRILDRAVLQQELPFFLEALENAGVYGSSEIVQPVLIDMVWFHLVDNGDTPTREPVTVALDGTSYRVFMGW